MFEYDVLAKYFDLYFNHTNDIPFWQDMSKRLGSPILELSCGTGRLAFPIAETGVAVTGLDYSVSMLNIAKKKLKKLPISIQRRVKLVHGDSVSFSLPNKFRAIFSAESFWAVSDEDQTKMLNSIKSHLLPGGYLVMSIYNFHERTEDIKTHQLKTCKYFPDFGFTLTRQCFVEGKAGSNIDKIVHFLDRVYENGTIKRIVTERIERQRTKDELVRILNSHGFAIQKLYGEYDMTPWSDSTKWTIVVARLPYSKGRNTLLNFIRNIF